MTAPSGASEQGGPGLTAFQIEVARLFFSLPESRGFLLAGGAALLAQLARAAHIDAGFDQRVLAEMLTTLDRFTDAEIPVSGDTTPADLRAFYATWQSELSA